MVEEQGPNPMTKEQEEIKLLGQIADALGAGHLHPENPGAFLQPITVEGITNVAKLFSRHAASLLNEVEGAIEARVKNLPFQDGDYVDLEFNTYEQIKRSAGAIQDNGKMMALKDLLPALAALRRKHGVDES